MFITISYMFYHIGGVDYTEVSTEITLSLSNSFQEVLIPISDDTVYDGPEDEKFLITATIKSGQNTDRIDVPISSQTITIVDNEPRPSELTRLCCYHGNHMIKYRTSEHVHVYSCFRAIL